MTKDELIRDLCSVEFRSKSKTRELIDNFITELRKQDNLNLLEQIPLAMKRSRKVIKDYYNK